MKKSYSNPSGFETDDDFPQLTPSTEGLILPQGPIPEQTNEENQLPLSRRNNQSGHLFEKIVYLVLGGLIAAGNEVSGSLKETNIQSAIDDQSSEVFSYQDEEENQFKYALIGLILKTPKFIEKSYRSISYYTAASYSIVNRVTRPFTGNKFINPFQKRYDGLVQKGETIVNELIDTGRRGEIATQNYATSALDDIIETLVANLADRPEIRDLVQQQSIGLAQEITNELQDRASAIDAMIEKIVFKLVPGEKIDTTPIVTLPLDQEGFEIFTKMNIRNNK